MNRDVSYVKTILIVDDELLIRKCMSDMLVHEGYKVLLANDGVEAIITYVENMDTIDLVLMDIVMPNKDGVTAYKEIVEIDPQVKIILMSAFTTPSFSNLENIRFIQKPIPSPELIAMVKEAL
jgi:DNA-binding NtrC family response regulator